jgi:hypothetical protein
MSEPYERKPKQRSMSRKVGRSNKVPNAVEFRSLSVMRAVLL